MRLASAATQSASTGRPVMYGAARCDWQATPATKMVASAVAISLSGIRNLGSEEFDFRAAKGAKLLQFRQLSLCPGEVTAL